jgi:integrase
MQGAETTNENNDTPTVEDFTKDWFEENQIRWKRSYRYMIRSTLDGHLLPVFGQKKVSSITKGEVLKFRSTLAKVSNGNKEGLSPDRINHIMTPLRMILADAADRHNFTTPFIGIKPLKVPRTEVDPFSLDEVRQFLAKVRADFRDYYIVRFFTGMRTSEIDGLKWSNVDFERRQILIRETVVMGEEDTTKTDCSRRFIEMSKPVYEALLSQHKVTGAMEGFVFCTRTGEPMNYSNVTNRVWYPTLALLGLKKRRPYQTMHTTATLWLASGENPEWIARQMGHSTTKMLFTIYSRYVPNITRQDGSAFNRLITAGRESEV